MIQTDRGPTWCSRKREWNCFDKIPPEVHLRHFRHIYEDFSLLLPCYLLFVEEFRWRWCASEWNLVRHFHKFECRFFRYFLCWDQLESSIKTQTRAEELDEEEEVAMMNGNGNISWMLTEEPTWLCDLDAFASRAGSGSVSVSERVCNSFLIPRYGPPSSSENVFLLSIPSSV